MKTAGFMVRGSAAVLLLLFAAASAGGAVGGEPGLPGRPWVIVEFAGARDLADAWAGAALGRMMADPEIAPALREARTAMQGAILSQAPDLPDRCEAEETLNSLVDMLGSSWMLGIYPPPEPGAPPSLAMTARLDDPAAALPTRLRAALVRLAGAEALEEIPIPGAEAFRIRGGQGLSAFAAAGNRFSAASSPELLGELLTAQGLPADATAILSRLETGVPAARFYIDMGAIIDMIAAQDSEKARALDAFGLNDCGALGIEIGIDGEMIRWAGRFTFRGERLRRSVERLRADPLSDEDLASIPPNAFSFSVTRMDLAPLWDYTIEGLGRLFAEGIGELNDVLADVKDHTGIDVERDIVRALGTRVASYSTPGAGMMPGMGNMTILWTLRDPERFRTALDRAMSVAAEAIEGQQAVQQAIPFRLRIQSSEAEGIRVWYLTGLPLAAPSVGIGADALAFTLQPNACRAELLRLRSPTASILSNPEFASVWARLRARVQSVSYEDLRVTIPDLYRTAMSFAPMLAALTGVQMDLAKLPTSDAIARYLGPSFSWDGVDEEGRFFAGTSPIGITGAGNPANPVLLGMGAALALPAIAQSRDQARSVACINHLKMIGLALWLYEADSQDGRLPGRLTDLVPTYVSVERALSCPAGGGYLYLAPAVRLGDIQDPAEFVMAMDDAPRHRDGRHALFADGHVQWIPEERAQAVLERFIAPSPTGGE